MAEDYDESDPHADEDGSDSDSMAGHKQDGEEPKNLFTSATGNTDYSFLINYQ